MAKIDELIVEVKGDVADILKKLNQVADTSDKTSKEVVTSFGSMKDGIAAVGKGLAVFNLAVEGAQKVLAPFASIVETLGKNADILKLSKQLNISAEAFQKFAFSGKRVGATMEDVFDSIKDLNINIIDASKGATGYEEALNAVGLKSRELIKLSPEERVYAYAEALRTATADARTFANDALASDPLIRWSPALEGGKDLLKSAGDEAKKLGAVLSDDTLFDSKKAVMAINTLDTSWETLKGTIASVVDEPLTDFLTMINDIINGTNKITAAIGRVTYDKARNEIEETNQAIAKARQEIRDLKEIAEPKEGNFFDDLVYSMTVGQGRIDEAKTKIGELEAKIEGLIAKRRELAFTFPTESNVSNNVKTSGSNSISKEFETRPSSMGRALGNAMGDGGDGVAEQINAMMSTDDNAYPMYGPSAEEFETIKSTQLEQFINLQEIMKEEADRARSEEYESQKLFNESLQALEKANQDYNKKLWESGWKGKSEIMSKTLGSMTTLMNSENRKMFEIGKAAAIAQVAIDTPKAAMSAYSAMAGIPYVGPFLGAAAAAAALATGAMQIQNIKGQSFGGGGGSGGGVISSEGGASAEGGDRAPTRNVTEATINISGSNFSGDTIRQLATELNELSDDGFVIKAGG